MQGFHIFRIEMPIFLIEELIKSILHICVAFYKLNNHEFKDGTDEYKQQNPD
jgi:hypothetical protein